MRTPQSDTLISIQSKRYVIQNPEKYKTSYKLHFVKEKASQETFKTIIILAADKGNATVVTNTLDYKQKIQDLLDPSTYRKLSRDSTSLRKSNDLIKLSYIPNDTKRLLWKPQDLMDCQKYIN